MVYTVEQLTEKMRDFLKKSPAPPGSVKLSLKGAGLIRIEGETVTNDDRPADCTLFISKPDLDQMIDGTMDTDTAMMRGKLEVVGDIGVAAAMQWTILTAWQEPHA